MAENVRFWLDEAALITPEMARELYRFTFERAELFVCQRCHGTGKISHPWRGTVSPCEACYGTGKVPK